MNLTLSIDEQTVERAREVANQQGTSLNALIREFVERLAGRSRGVDTAAALHRLWAERSPAPRGGKPYVFSRADAYDANRTGKRRG